MSHPLNPLDRGWLMQESADTPAHLGALLVFRLPEGAGRDYLGQMVERLRASGNVAPPWNYRLDRRLRHAFRPQWLEDPQPDLEYHLRHSALSAPGGERELGVLVSRLHSHALDLNRPPWECHLIEGLQGGRYAVYVKLHHALTDFTGFLGMLTVWLSADPRKRNMAPPWARAAEPSGRSQAGARVATALRSLTRRGEAGPAAALGGAFGRLLLARSKSAAGLRAPYDAPRSVLNVRIGAQRRFATQQYDRARLQRVADALDARLDEVLLYLCGSALRRFFREYNALPDQPLVAAVPGLRQSGAASEVAYGSIGFVSLETQLADPGKRLAGIRQSLRAAREHLDAVPDPLVPLYTLGTAAPYLLGQLSGLNRLAPAMFNLFISDQAGPGEPLYDNGARLEAWYPMYPLTQGTALSITCLHYAGTLNIGFCGARETLPSLQRMAVYMGQALADVEESIAAGALP